MGEAEDIYFAKRKEENEQAQTQTAIKVTALRQQISALLPSALSNWRHLDYRGPQGTITFNDQERVAWLAWYDDDFHSSKVYLLADGTFIQSRSLPDTVMKYDLNGATITMLESIVTALRYLSEVKEL